MLARADPVSYTSWTAPRQRSYSHRSVDILYMNRLLPWQQWHILYKHQTCSHTFEASPHGRMLWYVAILRLWHKLRGIIWCPIFACDVMNGHACVFTKTIATNGLFLAAISHFTLGLSVSLQSLEFAFFQHFWYPSTTSKPPRIYICRGYGQNTLAMKKLSSKKLTYSQKQPRYFEDKCGGQSPTVPPTLKDSVDSLD